MMNNVRRSVLRMAAVMLALVLLAGCTGRSGGGNSTPGNTSGPEEEIKVKPEDYKVTERYFIYRVWNFNVMQINPFKSTVDAAAEDGFNAIMIHIPWLQVEKGTHGEYKFDAFDRMIDYVIKDKGLKAIISVDLTRRENDKLLPEECFMRSRDGRLCTGGVSYNKNEISFSSETAVEYAVAFYKELCRRYDGMYGKDILAYMPAFSQYAETEYWCTDEYDYSDCAVSAYKQYLKDEFGTVEELNKKCGVSFVSFDAVEAPSLSDRSDFGITWYNFRHRQLKRAIDALSSAQKSVAPDTKFAVQFGSVFDGASYLRGTYNFPDLCENADICWTDDGPTYNHTFSMDYLRSNLPLNVQIASEIDGPAQSGASVENYFRQGEECYAHGATYVNIANWFIDDNYRQYKETWQTISAKWISGNGENVIPTASTEEITVTLEDMLKGSGFDKAVSAYNGLKAQDQFVFIRLKR